MTLSRNKIIEACRNNKLVDPWQESMVQTCSYDLTFSGEYQMYTAKDKGKITKLNEGEKLVIPADAICFVLTAETVTIPPDLTAHISLSLSLIKKGVMMAAQPPYDAGYSGKTLALLHNLSSKPVKIAIGQHVLNIVFERLTNPVKKEDLYSTKKGKYHEADSLKDFDISTKTKGGVFDLAERLRKQNKKFNNFLPNIITIITVIIAFVTLLITIPTVKDSVEDTINFFNNKSGYLPPAENTDESSFDDNGVILLSNEENETIVLFNGNVYKIDFDNLQISKYE